MKTTKKLLSVLLAALMVALTCACLSVCFTAGALSSSGSCGYNLTYSFNSSTGALTISGTGSKIYDNAFKNCTEIKSVSVPSSVTNIGEYAFYYCENIESVSLPSNLQTVGKFAFCGCKKLELIRIPTTVTTIGIGAFQGCAFKKVMIPAGVTTISDGAFNGCTSLETVIIGKDVRTIGSSAFNSCLKLKDVYYKGSEWEWNNQISIGSYNSDLKSATMHYNAASNLKVVQITASASPAAAGTVLGGGIYLTGESVTLTAAPNTGYVFDAWYYRSNRVSTNAAYTFSASSDGALEADFRTANRYTVSVSASPSEGGTVTRGGSYYEGTSVTVTATPATGYKFVQWKESGAKVSSNEKYTFTLQKNVSLTAYFEKKQSCNIVFKVEPAEGGKITGATSGTYYVGDTVRVKAVPNEGYHFDCWYWYYYDSSTGVEKKRTWTDAAPGFLVSAGTEDWVITAKFVKDGASENPQQPDNPSGGNNNPTQPQQQSGSCPYCGGTHTGFPGILIGLLHRVLALFGLHK